MIELIPILILAGLLVWQQRRHDEAEKSWRLERVGLLNRIQAPEVEVAKEFEPHDDTPAYVPFEDDEAFNAYQKELSGSGS